ncbi:MAG: hypothetical protein RLZZ113_783, partial [Pseudomonadota bacterium]
FILVTMVVIAYSEIEHIRLCRVKKRRSLAQEKGSHEIVDY